MRPPPLFIEVYDKNFVAQGAIGNPKFVTVAPIYNGAGTATISVPNSHRLIPDLIADGARLWIRDEDRNHLMSGWITRIRGSAPAQSGFMEFDIVDDFNVLNDVLGWVVPTAAITGQGSAGEYYTLSGSAEYVLKAAVIANAVTRLGMPLTVATNLDRGSAVTARLRFHPLYERLFPVVDGSGIEAAGVGVTVKQVGSGLVLDCFTPSLYPRTLSELGGAVVDWSWSKVSTTATRVVVGGQGEAQARVLRNYVDTAREAAVGHKIERFRDARDVDDVADLPARGQETLDDGAPKSGLSITLAQTENLRYGRSISVGDRVNLEVGPGVVISDIMREATLSWTSEDGWQVTPKVGDRSDDPDTMLARTIRRLARAISNSTRT